METDNQEGLSPLTDDADPAVQSADPMAYARIVVPLPTTDSRDATPIVPGGRDEETDKPEPTQPGVVRRHPFEIYVTGQASVNAWPKVKCAWGTVCKVHTADGAATITARTSTFTLEAEAYFYLKTVFNSAGTVLTCELVMGVLSAPWAGYPEQFSADGLTWYHPIAQVRSYLAANPESGEVVLKDSQILAQLTNTHLRVAQACGMDAAMTRHWKLEPGPGAIL